MTSLDFNERLFTLVMETEQRIPTFVFMAIIWVEAKSQLPEATGLVVVLSSEQKK
jgi:hypothetical protein